MDELYIGGLNNNPVYQTPVYYNVTNLHAGIIGFQFNTIAFNFDKTSFVLSSVGSYAFINVSIWNYRERLCSASFPYYEINSNLCYDTCPAGYVDTDGATKKYCKACGTLINACN